MRLGTGENDTRSRIAALSPGRDDLRPLAVALAFELVALVGAGIVIAAMITYWNTWSGVANFAEEAVILAVLFALPTRVVYAIARNIRRVIA